MDAAFRRDVRAHPFFQGKEGASLDGYVRTTNDILFNPEDTIERVEQAYEEHLEADGDDGSQASLAGERALASTERVSDDLQEKVNQFEEREVTAAAVRQFTTCLVY